MVALGHSWIEVVANSAGVKLETCERCGLFRLKTLSSEFYLVQWRSPQPPALRCPIANRAQVGGKA